jgi:magnesium transporter
MNIQTINFKELSFVNVSDPKDFEMKYLLNSYDFDPLNLEDYTHKTQIPKIENYKKYDLLVLRFPLFTEHVPKNSHLYGVKIPMFPSTSTKRRRIMSSYVNFFISKDHVVVLHSAELPQINKIFNYCQKSIHNRSEYMSRGSAYLAYRIIDALVDDCFPVINEITSTIEKVDDELERKQSQKTLEEISATRRNLVVFHTMIKPTLPLFSEMEQGKHKEFNQMQPYWGNILDHLQKILDRVEDNQELIEGITESNESLISSQSNQIIKVLTIFSAVILPLNLLASLYGMNLDLPFVNEAFIFWKIVLVMIGMTILMLLGFMVKKWI